MHTLRKLLQGTLGDGLGHLGNFDNAVGWDKSSVSTFRSLRGAVHGHIYRRSGSESRRKEQGCARH
jgi:hypothetical protein